MKSQTFCKMFSDFTFNVTVWVASKSVFFDLNLVVNFSANTPNLNSCQPGFLAHFRLTFSLIAIKCIYILQSTETRINPALLLLIQSLLFNSFYWYQSHFTAHFRYSISELVEANANANSTFPLQKQLRPFTPCCKLVPFVKVKIKNNKKHNYLHQRITSATS